MVVWASHNALRRELTLHRILICSSNPPCVLVTVYCKAISIHTLTYKRTHFRFRSKERCEQLTENWADIKLEASRRKKGRMMQSMQITKKNSARQARVNRFYSEYDEITFTCDLGSTVVSWRTPGQLAVFGVDVTHLKVLRCSGLVCTQPATTESAT